MSLKRKSNLKKYFFKPPFDEDNSPTDEQEAKKIWEKGKI